MKVSLSKQHSAAELIGIGKVIRKAQLDFIFSVILALALMLLPVLSNKIKLLELVSILSRDCV